MTAGRMISARRGAGHDLHSLRDYQAQDDVRHIDWKATARARRLMVREFTAEDLWRVHVVFDTRVRERANDEVNANGAEAMNESAVRFERGVTLAASLVAHFIEERAEVQLTLGSETTAYGTSREHLYACLRRLALARPTSLTDDVPPQTDYIHTIAASVADDAHYVILLTTAEPGTIPGNLWRRSHVIYL